MTETATIRSPKAQAAPDDVQGITIGWHPNVPDAEKLRNCEIAKRSGFPQLTKMPKNVTLTPCVTPCVIVGTGLSAVKLLPEIKALAAQGAEIIALKGAHDWLIENGVMPTAAVAIDAQKSRAKCFRLLRPGVVYLCASQMHPDTWEHLKGYQVVIWHQLIVKDQQQMPEWTDCPLLLMGASSTGNSAIFLMHAIGRRNIHLYGIDSSLPAPHWWNRWIMPRLKLDGARVNNGSSLHEVEVDGRRYWTTPEMAVQVEEIELMAPYIKGATIKAHGDGYYQATLNQLMRAR